MLSRSSKFYRSLYLMLSAAILLFLLAPLVRSQNLLWSANFGGRYNERVGACLESVDGNNLIVGSTYSFGSGDYDVYLLKTDPGGDTLWSKTFGGPGTDHGYAIAQTADSGFVLVGSSASYSSGDNDFYIVRLDPDGNEIWSTTYGGTGQDEARAVAVLSDGGFLVAGNYETVSSGYSDGLLLRLNSQGETLWSKAYGGVNDELLYDMKRTPDNNYILFGTTMSYGTGYSSFYALKVDPSGDTLWTQTYGGTKADLGRSVQLTSDGGYIFAGRTYSYGAGSGDAYLVKTDSEGTIQWENFFGGRLEDRAFSVCVAADGGYLVVGTTESFGAGGIDIYVIKTDPLGQEIWSQTYGGQQADYASGIIQDGNHNYFIAGHSYSVAVGGSDIYVLSIEGDSPTPVEEYAWDNLLPQAIELGQNYPNPFNSTTTIPLSLSRPATIRVTLYNLLGQTVKSFGTINLPVGDHYLTWDGRNDYGRDVASGLYFFRIETSGLALTRKMILLK